MDGVPMEYGLCSTWMRPLVHEMGGLRLAMQSLRNDMEQIRTHVSELKAFLLAEKDEAPSTTTTRFDAMPNAVHSTLQPDVNALSNRIRSKSVSSQSVSSQFNAIATNQQLPSLLPPPLQLYPDVISSNLLSNGSSSSACALRASTFSESDNPSRSLSMDSEYTSTTSPLSQSSLNDDVGLIHAHSETAVELELPTAPLLPALERTHRPLRAIRRMRHKYLEVSTTSFFLFIHFCIFFSFERSYMGIYQNLYTRLYIFQNSSSCEVSEHLPLYLDNLEETKKK
jgi:hypothetical protein